MTSQDEPLDASIETFEMSIQRFDVGWKSSGFSIPNLDHKFPRSKVQLGNGLIEKNLDKSICLTMATFNTDIVTPSSEK